MAKGDKQKAHIEWVMKIHEIKYEKEYLGLKPRKFRFDFAIVEDVKHKIAIEYEGIFTEKQEEFTGKVTRQNLARVLKLTNKNKSRHTTVTGYTGDVQKYNLAVIKGWKVLRYTAKNISEFEDDLLALIKNDEKT